MSMDIISFYSYSKC